jgi:hypothetical protein
VAKSGCPAVFLALFGSANLGCLLFSNPINTEPAVTLTCSQEQDSIVVTCAKDQAPPGFVRNRDIKFQAVATDPDQDTASLRFDWYVGKSCNTVLDQPPANQNRSLASFILRPKDFDPGCVGVVVTDSQGASAAASVPFAVVNQPPTAELEISSTGLASPLAGQPLMLPLYAKVTITGKDSNDPDDTFDQLSFGWSVSSGASVVSMPGCPDPNQKPYLCTFTASSPGSYQVVLFVRDQWDGLSKPPAALPILVADDQLPNIVLDLVRPAPPSLPSDPPLPLLASLDNTFTVNRVEDDGDPYPSSDPANPYPTPPAGFVWFYKTDTDPAFLRLAKETGPSFTIRAGTFPPQERIWVRVEYHDRVTACQPKVAGCGAVFDACNRADPSAIVCASYDQRAQWVTWPVVFR